MFIAMSLCRSCGCGVSIAMSHSLTAAAAALTVVLVVMTVVVTDSWLRILIQMSVWRGFLSVSSLTNVCSVVDGGG